MKSVYKQSCKQSRLSLDEGDALYGEVHGLIDSRTICLPTMKRMEEEIGPNFIILSIFAIVTYFIS